MDSLLLDVRFALRSLARRRLFTVVALGTIALAIGAATSIYSVVDGVLFRSLPYRDPGKLVAVWQTIPSWRKEPILAAQWDRVVLGYYDFRRWRDGQKSFSAVGAWTTRSMMITSGEAPEQVTSILVSPSLFDVLGVHALVGRTFLPGEDVLGGPRVALVSYDTWQTRFGGRRGVVGTNVVLDSVPFQLVGVLPKDFTIARGRPAPPFILVAGQDSSDLESQDNHNYTTIGRLASGVTIERAATEANQLLRGAQSQPPRGIRLLEYQLDQTRDVRAPLFILLGAVGVLVLVACVNVATLLLGEAAAREPEMGARAALGATRWRLARQLLTESVILSAAGSALGVALAWWMTHLLIAIAPPRIPGIATARVDGRVLAVSSLLAILTGVLFGLVPSLALSSAGTARLLRAGGHSGRGRARLQRILIGAELALSVVLLVGAGLLSRSLSKLTAVSPGFRTDRLLLVRTATGRGMFKDAAALRALYAVMMERVTALPGVSAVTAGVPLPFSGGTSSSLVHLPADLSLPEATAPRREAQQRVIVANFFQVLGIPLLAGRAFTVDDRLDGQLVAIVSEALARRDWPNESPVGKIIQYQGAMRTVVGVVGDTKVNKLGLDDQPTIYTPLTQRLNSMTLVIRTSGDPAAMTRSIRAAVHDAAPMMPVQSADLMEDRIRLSTAEERFRTLLIDLFGAIAGVLAAVGMYGVTARAVSRRTREVGIRVALGATAPSVIRLIVGGTMGGVAAGVAVGMLAAAAASQLLSPFLYGVGAHDPTTYAAIVALLAGVSVAASWIPARRAGRVQPATVLRGE